MPDRGDLLRQSPGEGCNHIPGRSGLCVILDVGNRRQIPGLLRHRHVPPHVQSVVDVVEHDFRKIGVCIDLMRGELDDWNPLRLQELQPLDRRGAGHPEHALFEDPVLLIRSLVPMDHRKIDALLFEILSVDRNRSAEHLFDSFFVGSKGRLLIYQLLLKVKLLWALPSRNG